MNLTSPVFTKNADQISYHVTHACPTCGHISKGEIQAPDLFKWNQGATAQTAFPYLSATQREALFVSGICGFCWPTDDEDAEDWVGLDDDTFEDDTYTSGEQYVSDYLNSDSNIAYLNR